MKISIIQKQSNRSLSKKPNLYFAPPLKIRNKIFFSFWKYTLAVMMICYLYSCEKGNPIHPEQERIAMSGGKIFTEMTPEEKQVYVESLNFREGESNYIKTWIDSSAHAPGVRQNRLALRSSYNCGINVELSIYGPADTARVTVYEANTSTVVHGPVLMVDNDDFNMTISGAEYYDFKIEPIDNPTGSTMGNLIVDPDWGGKTIYSFSGPGIDFNEDFHFECPAPEPDGTCYAEVAIEKYAGDADSYQIEFDDGTTKSYVTVSGVWNDFEPIEIDEQMTYDIKITPQPPSAVYEDYRFNILRPDQISHFYYMYHLGNTTGNINDINYLECPY